MAHILIVGAGVIGLQTAVTLLEAGYKVTVVARDWPGDHSSEYTSPWAGAIWRSHASAEQAQACEWDLQGYKEWMRIAEDEPQVAEKMGIMKCPIRIYSELPTKEQVWYAKHVKDYEDISRDELPKSTRGHVFSSIAVNPEKYLEYLLDHVKASGASFVNISLPTDTGIASSLNFAPTKASLDSTNLAAVVNCTGLSASQFCGDKNMYPIRGQTLLVRFSPPIPREISLKEAKDSVTYIVPRPGTGMFILGGTKDSGNVDPIPTANIKDGILNRCQQLLGSNAHGADIEIIAEQVGFRPGRKGGVRLEVEEVDIGHDQPVKVIHNYGHAGTGYQASIGSAIKVLKQIQEIIPQ